MHVDRAVLGDAPQFADFAREGMRKHRLALHQTAIAVGGLLARVAPVEQHDLLAALLQMRGDRHADHPGAENDDIGLHSTCFPAFGWK
jgi:hypothetical protein